MTTLEGNHGQGSQDQRDDAVEKPLHNLPMGKQAWNPPVLRRWWFWPTAALLLVVLGHVYPYVWKLLSP